MGTELMNQLDIMRKEGRLGKLNSNMAYQGQVRQKAAARLMSLYKWMAE